MREEIEYNSEIKRLVEEIPNDQELGKAIRTLVTEENCCAIKSNHRKSGERLICKICGTLIN